MPIEPLWERVPHFLTLLIMPWVVIVWWGAHKLAKAGRTHAFAAVAGVLTILAGVETQVILVWSKPLFYYPEVPLATLSVSAGLGVAMIAVLAWQLAARRVARWYSLLIVLGAGSIVLNITDPLAYLILAALSTGVL